MTDNHLFQLAQVISDLPRRSSPTLPPLDHRHDRRILPLRKNYAIDCTCEETQPRRGKNLPQHCLDSRAKKLNQADKEDYDFAIQWLQENAHAIYRDAASNQVVDLSNQTEVGLCKAHSSTLYRAKKRWEKETFTSTPASPSDYMDTNMDFTPSNSNSTNNHTATTSSALVATSKTSSTSSSSSSSTRIKTEMGGGLAPIKSEIGGGLAAKVKELSQHPPPPPTPQLPSDLNIIPSTSHKRKRIDQNGLSTKTQQLPSSGSAMLPHSSASTPFMPSDEPCIYFIRNLAITDTFTFRHLLDETDITGAPPPGKRIIIADPTSERIFPLSQAIRSVLPRPVSSHVEFCLGLTDKTSIDWSSCT
ncbi:hypothetical protein BCR42DRAFT_397167 [Absidia repens]|uniref:Uncharacterized protein n=1 Tax=Absidia repens TaxID=90262 RepID=A0A1X2I210_9FUNG|nr:hypothetical protein BCR42DRAFT_397167 [Absidia repens]